MADSSKKSNVSRKRKYVPDPDEEMTRRPLKKQNSSTEDDENNVTLVPTTSTEECVAPSKPETVIEETNKTERQPLASLPIISIDSSEETDVDTVIDSVPLECPSSTSSVPSDFSPHTDDNISLSSWPINHGDRTPHDRKCQNKPTVNARYRCVPCCVTSSSDQRVCALPRIKFAEAEDVWRLMCRQDEKSSLERDPKMLELHKGLHLRMRAILLDWLIEVCEVYKLHRDTYYLAVDYLDRYLSNVDGTVQKNHLQLIGVTCLFIAAKVEEIYPPKISEFAYITDGACSEEDILRQELGILATLQWKMNPTTVSAWISLYMQINRASTLKPSEPRTRARRSLAERMIAENRQAEAFVYPQFSAMEFTKVTQLADLCSLDVEMANFPYSVVAAAAVSHIFDRKTGMKVSGFDWDSLEPCYRWMEPFNKAIIEEGNPIFLMEQNEQINSPSGLTHISPNIITDESHTLQAHTTSLKMFDKALQIRQQLTTELKLATPIVLEESPASGLQNVPTCLLTPPASNRKSLEAVDSTEPSTASYS